MFHILQIPQGPGQIYNMPSGVGVSTLWHSVKTGLDPVLHFCAMIKKIYTILQTLSSLYLYIL